MQPTFDNRLLLINNYIKREYYREFLKFSPKLLSIKKHTFLQKEKIPKISVFGTYFKIKNTIFKIEKSSFSAINLKKENKLCFELKKYLTYKVHID